jgi:hypothetical protein
MERINRKNFTLIFMIIAVAFLVFPGASNDGITSRLWPVESRRASEDILNRYGKPDISTGEMLVWKKRGPWEQITVSRTGALHRFPFEHYDVLEQSIQYRVPVEKLQDLIMFDGSLLIDRTRGTMSARCDHESSNILILNLAHEVATGEKSVAEARQAYGKIVEDKSRGADPMLMKELTFAVHLHAPDPDLTITGLPGNGPVRARKSWLGRFISQNR